MFSVIWVCKNGDLNEEETSWFREEEELAALKRLDKRESVNVMAMDLGIEGSTNGN